MNEHIEHNPGLLNAIRCMASAEQRLRMRRSGYRPIDQWRALEPEEILKLRELVETAAQNISDTDPWRQRTLLSHMVLDRAVVQRDRIVEDARTAADKIMSETRTAERRLMPWEGTWKNDKIEKYWLLPLTVIIKTVSDADHYEPVYAYLPKPCIWHTTFHVYMIPGGDLGRYSMHESFCSPAHPHSGPGHGTCLTFSRPLPPSLAKAEAREQLRIMLEDGFNGVNYSSVFVNRKRWDPILRTFIPARHGLRYANLQWKPAQPVTKVWDQ